MYTIEEQYKLNKIRFEQLSVCNKNLFAMMALERQWKVYERAAIGQKWDRRTIYREVLDTCWRSIVEGKEILEITWEISSENMPENLIINKKVELDNVVAFAGLFVENLLTLLDALIEGHEDNESVTQLNFDFLEPFIHTYMGIEEKKKTLESLKCMN